MLLFQTLYTFKNKTAEKWNEWLHWKQKWMWVCNFIGRQEYMVIIKQDPGFFLNYVIVHCNFSCSVGATHRQELKQSANYKDGTSPHLLSLLFFSFSWPFPSQLWHIVWKWVAYSLKTISIVWVEVDVEVPRAKQEPCSWQPSAQAEGGRAGAERQGSGPALSSSPIRILLHSTTPRKYPTTLSFPPSCFISFKY